MNSKDCACVAKQGKKGAKRKKDKAGVKSGNPTLKLSNAGMLAKCLALTPLAMASTLAACFFLMSEGKHVHRIGIDFVVIECRIPGVSEWDDQLAKFWKIVQRVGHRGTEN